MFSKDPKHNRPTPRSIQQAFGPYHKMRVEKPESHGVFTVFGMLVLGIIFGLLLAWRG
jgi:hypothetical protein